MGAYMKEDDIYIGTFLDLFNLRFAPVPFSDFLDHESLYGGIDEMAKLQDEFKIFRRDRLFSDSAAILGLGGFDNARAKNRWFTLLRRLPRNGDQQLANAMVANFRRRKALPCYMRAHFFEDPKSDSNRVIITEGEDPLFYLEQEYLVISLPMAPRTKPTRGTKKKAKK
jgi:hypothetical protein